MFVQTVDDQLVNLNDKDITIKPSWSSFDNYSHSVVAEGPTTYGWNEDFIGGKTVTLHSGTEDECKEYLEWLAASLNAIVAPRYPSIPSTPRTPEEKEEVTLPSNRYDDGIPF